MNGQELKKYAKDNGWDEYRLMVMQELLNHREALAKHGIEIGTLHDEIKSLHSKANLVSLLAASGPPAVAILLKLLGGF